jgi:hypothetical protein
MPVKRSEKQNSKSKNGSGTKGLRILTALAVAACILLSVPSLAFADSGADPALSAAESSSGPALEGSWEENRTINLRGTGILEANGDGVARIRANTTASADGIIRLSGNGVLLVRDIEGDLDKNITGYGGRVELNNDLWLYYGFSGKAELKGSGFTVALMGKDIDLYAKGKGSVFLAGTGTYTVYRDNEDDTV